MANRTPQYFLAATWDLPPPPSGPIRLGSIIASAHKPERPLYTPPPGNNGQDDNDSFSTEQHKFHFSTEKLRAGRFEIFTRSLSTVLGLGVDASVGWETLDASTYTFDTLETIQFIPKPGYISGCIASSDAVRRYLEKTRYRKPVYVVTGIKIARGAGAKAKSLRSRALSAETTAEVDALVWAGVPVAAGPGVAKVDETRQNVAWEGGSDFVFAYRLSKVMVDKKTGGVKSERDYTRGTMLGLEDAPAANSEDVVLGVVLNSEVSVDEELFSLEKLKDGDEEVVCAVPNLDAFEDV